LCYFLLKRKAEHSQKAVFLGSTRSDRTKSESIRSPAFKKLWETYKTWKNAKFVVLAFTVVKPLLFSAVRNIPGFGIVEWMMSFKVGDVSLGEHGLSYLTTLSDYSTLPVSLLTDVPMD